MKLALLVIMLAASQIAMAGDKSKAPGVTKEIITFKGIPLGKANTKSDLVQLCIEEKLPNLECAEKKGALNLVTAFGKLQVNMETLALQGKVILTSTFNSQDGIDSIIMPQVKTSSILETIPLLEEKYGKPKITTESLQNMRGSQLESKIFTWKDAQGNTLNVISIDSRIDEGGVIFRSAAENARKAVEAKQSEAAAKSNL